MKQNVAVRLIILDQASRVLLREEDDLYDLPSETLNGDQPDEVAVNVLAKALGAQAAKPKLTEAFLAKDNPTTAVELNLIFTSPSPSMSAVKEQGMKWVLVKDLQRQQLRSSARRALFNDSAKELQSDEGMNVGKNDMQNTTDIQPGSTLTIHTDGGSRGNPGPSAAAFVILDDDGRAVFKEGKYLGITTNNQAEYQAVKMALEKGAALEAKVVNFRMDSLLIVNQMSGIYKIKNRDLWPIYTAIQELRKRFQNVTFTHVPRELNREADALVNEVLDAQ